MIDRDKRAFSVQVEDKLLVWRLNRGDAAALSRVYEKYRDDLLRLAASMLSDAAAAEDIVQDVFVRFAGLARTFRLTGSLKGFPAIVLRRFGVSRRHVRRVRQSLAIVTLLAGLLIGITAFCLDFEPISGHMYLTRGLGIPFMMQAWWSFVICTVIYFAISYSTPRPAAEVIENYTWDNPLAIITRGQFNGWKDVRLWAGILLLTLVALYVIF